MSLKTNNSENITRGHRGATWAENIRRKMERKRELLCPYVEGKTVLHLGFVGANADGSQDDYWLHGWVDGVAERVVGLDLQEEGVIRAQQQGFEAILADAQDFEVADEFDVVVATNIIEHVPSPGRMLDSARKALAPDGKIVITTPRTMIPWNAMREWKGGMDPHDEHKMWFCRATLEALVESCGFDVVEYQSWGFDRVGVTLPDKTWRVVERMLTSVWPAAADYQHFLVATPSENTGQEDA